MVASKADLHRDARPADFYVSALTAEGVEAWLDEVLSCRRVAGSRMLEVFPVVPLARGQGLSIGMTSYDGRVFFGLNADRDSVRDVDVLADLIEQEVGELVEAAG